MDVEDYTQHVWWMMKLRPPLMLWCLVDVEVYTLTDAIDTRGKLVCDREFKANAGKSRLIYGTMASPKSVFTGTNEH